jgi:hypothetical protein
MAQEKNVACICPSIMIYNEWVRENAVKGEQYIWVYNEDKIRGLRFHRLVKLFKYWTIKDIDRILRFIIIDPQDVERLVISYNLIRTNESVSNKHRP